jgi:hypothetical protein
MIKPWVTHVRSDTASRHITSNELEMIVQSENIEPTSIALDIVVPVVTASANNTVTQNMPVLSSSVEFPVATVITTSTNDQLVNVASMSKLTSVAAVSATKDNPLCSDLSLNSSNIM